MKKLLYVLMIVLLLVFACAMLTACNNDENPDGLQMNTKYFYRYEWDGGFSIQTYVFKKNGSGTLYHYTSDGRNNFTQNFVYEFQDENKTSVVLFKTKLEYHGDEEKAEDLLKIWIDKLLVSKNFLIPDNNDHEPKFLTYEFSQKLEAEKGENNIYG